MAESESVLRKSSRLLNLPTTSYTELSSSSASESDGSSSSLSEDDSSSDETCSSLSEDDSLQCDQCDMNFSTEQSLRRHRRAAHKLFKCTTCGRSFKRNSHLKQHSVVHTNSKSESVVLRKSSRLLNLLSSSSSPADTSDLNPKKPNSLFPCDACPNSYTSSWGLRRHCKKQHKLFKCHICYRSFPWKSNFERHQRTHTGKNFEKCDVCGRKFSHGGSFDRHLRRLHQEILTCGVCGTQCRTRLALSHHKNSRHAPSDSNDESPTALSTSSTAPTSSSSASVASSAALEREQPFVCRICGESFPTLIEKILHRMANHSSIN